MGLYLPLPVSRKERGGFHRSKKSGDQTPASRGLGSRDAQVTVVVGCFVFHPPRLPNPRQLDNAGCQDSNLVPNYSGL